MHPKPPDVEHRRDRDCPVALTEPVPHDGVDRIPQEVVVGQHRPFGAPGGARRVHEATQIASSHVDAERPRLAARERLFEICLAVGGLAADQHSGAYLHALVGKSCAGKRGQVTRPHENMGSCVGQQVGHFRRGQPEVDGHKDSPQLRGGEHRLQEGALLSSRPATRSPVRTPISRNARASWSVRRSNSEYARRDSPSINAIRSPERKARRVAQLPIPPVVALTRLSIVRPLPGVVALMIAYLATKHSCPTAVRSLRSQPGGVRGSWRPFLAHLGSAGDQRRQTIKLKTRRRLPRTLSEESVQLIVDACDRLRDRFLIELLAGTGMRIGEVLGLAGPDSNQRARGIDTFMAHPDEDSGSCSR